MSAEYAITLSTFQFGDTQVEYLLAEMGVEGIRNEPILWKRPVKAKQIEGSVVETD